MIARFTQIDYDREMAFIAVSEQEAVPAEFGYGPLYHESGRALRGIRTGCCRRLTRPGYRYKNHENLDADSQIQKHVVFQRRSVGHQQVNVVSYLNWALVLRKFLMIMSSQGG